MGRIKDFLMNIWKDLGEDIPDEEHKLGFPTDDTAAIEDDYARLSRGRLLREELRRRKGDGTSREEPPVQATKRGRPRKAIEPERGE